MKRCVLVVVLCLAVSSILPAQTTFATLTGTVTDATGAVVPNAQVTATHTETGVELSTTSNEVGNYSLPQLRQGNYTVKATASGFRDFIAQNLVLAARDVRRLDVTLEVGTATTAIEVTGGATLIQAETARISDTQTATELTQIPMNARWIWAFMSLSPSVVSGDGGYRFSGSRANQNNWAIDGTMMSDGYGGYIGPLGNYVESFQEVAIGMANNSAEFGTIGQVSMISRGGANDFHGALFDYYYTPSFRARPYFAKERANTRYHLPGFSVNGPLSIPKLYSGKNKTFYFFSYETSRGNSSTQLLNPTVPIRAWRQGDFSGLRAGQLIYDPQSGQPFPGNKIPTSRLNPVSLKYQERFYPLPNSSNPDAFSTSNYIENKERPWYGPTTIVGRIDHHFSSRDFVFGRTTIHRTRNDVWEGNLPTVGQRIQQRDINQTSVSYTHIFGPTITNEARWGIAYNHNPVAGPIKGKDFVRDFGLVGLAPDLPDLSGLLKVRFSGLTMTGADQVNYSNPGYRNHNEDFSDVIAMTRGRHNLRFGAQVLRTIYNEMQANDALFGLVTFSPRFTGRDQANQGHPYADFLLGIPTTAQRAFAPIRADRRRWQTDFFITDDFKVSRRLTLNLGLRYERHSRWSEENGLLAMFDVGKGAIVIPDAAVGKVSPLFPKNYASIVTASSVGLPETLVRPDNNNFAPRIGFAYGLGKDTVVRGGWGIYYDLVPSEVSTAVIPYRMQEDAYTVNFQNPDVIFPRVFPNSGTGPSTVALPLALNTGMRTPYSMQYSLTVEHQAFDTSFRASYVGTNTRKGEYAYDYNSPLPDERLYTQKPRPFPQYNVGINYRTNGAGHQYNGLTLEARREMARGVYFQSAWTWARDIYDLTNGASPENPFDRERERAVAVDIPTHRFVTTAVWELPFGKGRKFGSGVNRLANLAVGGWEISGVYTLYSGQFLTPLVSVPDPVGIVSTTSNTRPLVNRRPDQLRDPNLPADQRSISRWFDTTAFAAPGIGRFGTSAKGVIKGPGTNIWNLGIAKSFIFTERMRLRWELTAVNAMNHPNWSNPGTTLTAQNAGIITNAAGVAGEPGGARELRTGFRLQW